VSTLVGVGVGPGDPELVTVKAVRVLREADVIFVPVMAGPGARAAGPGRAETTIRAHVPADRIRPVPFALNDTGGVTPRRAAAWQAAATEVARVFAAGAGTVAFGTIGDPNVYSTFSYLAQTVRALVPGVTVETVPGITAMQDLAARSATSLAEGDEPLTLLPLTAGAGALRAALAGPGTVVAYKLGAAAGPGPAEVTDLLAAHGRLDGAVAGARLGLPGQDIRPATDLAALPAVPYLSTLIVPAPNRTTPGSSLGTSQATPAPGTPAAPETPEDT
jgi:precorrin-2/cobalt-factor-2 C20-methyltransferase